MVTLVERVRARDPAAIARAISIVESQPADRARLLDALAGTTSQAYRVGVTGSPGVGKSSLVSRLVTEWRQRGRSVAVLAVDPSSPITGGALLGDRVRMLAHAGDRDVFIRSMATRGRLGGVASATSDAARVLDAAGFDFVVIETVGVGQDEVEVVRTADVCVVTLAPGAGDDVQALKAGVMEIADVFVVHKADLPGADRLAATLQATLSLGEAPEAGEVDARWETPVLLASAATNAGVTELADAIDRFSREGHAALRRHSRAERETNASHRLRPSSGVGLASTPRLDHVAIAVADAGPTTAFFEGLLGLADGGEEALPAHGVNVHFVDAGAGRLEVISPLGDASPIATFLARRGPGLHHVAFRVADLDRELGRLKSRGVRFIDDVPRLGAHGSRVAFVHPSSAGGVLVELVESPRPSGQ